MKKFRNTYAKNLFDNEMNTEDMYYSVSSISEEDDYDREERKEELRNLWSQILLDGSISPVVHF